MRGMRGVGPLEGRWGEGGVGVGAQLLHAAQAELGSSAALLLEACMHACMEGAAEFER